MLKPRVLVVDDEESLLKTYKSILKKHYEVITVNNGPKALDVLSSSNFSLAILDIMMPSMDGLELLRKIKELNPGIEVIMATAVKDIKSAVKAIKLGAYDYISKPFEIEELLGVVKKTLEKKDLVQENIYLKQTLKEKDAFCDLIGKTPVMRSVFDLIKQVAPSNSTVLITGESGTGKEIVAKAIHKQSLRAKKPFVAVNCAAIPESLIESEVFGFERGAFTGAGERKLGKFELADGGTLFLDEIGCMNEAMQAKLLRFLQDGTIEKVGGKTTLKVDVRIISATNLDLEQAIKKGKFREDLFYRLNVIPIHLPPLRDRRQDIPLFLDYFLDLFSKETKKAIKKLDAAALKILKNYNWPGNVRELQNLVERVVVLSKERVQLSAQDIPLLQAGSKEITPLKESVRQFEKEQITKALLKAGNNQTKAAQLLGINRTTLIEKMKTVKKHNK